MQHSATTSLMTNSSLLESLIRNEGIGKKFQKLVTSIVVQLEKYANRKTPGTSPFLL